MHFSKVSASVGVLAGAATALPTSLKTPVKTRQSSSGLNVVYWGQVSRVASARPPKITPLKQAIHSYSVRQILTLVLYIERRRHHREQRSLGLLHRRFWYRHSSVVFPLPMGQWKHYPFGHSWSILLYQHFGRRPEL